MYTYRVKPFKKCITHITYLSYFTDNMLRPMQSAATSTLMAG